MKHMDNSEAARRVREAVSSFIQELSGRVDDHTFEEVLVGRESSLVSDDLGQKPEAFAEDELIFPLLKSCELEWTRQIYEGNGDDENDLPNRHSWPDLGISNVDEGILGEAKPLNNVQGAEDDAIEYLDRISVKEDYGIATDGIEWRILKRDLSGDIGRVRHVKTVDLRKLIFGVAYSEGYFNSGQIDGVKYDIGEIDIDVEAKAFADVFARDGFERFLSIEVPQTLRDERKRDVDEFYELYIELLFGEGDDYDYDSCLMDDIVSPPGTEVDDSDRREFAVTLMNRLLFIKFLEDRGVIPEETLLDRVRYYESSSDDILQRFYDSQLKPLFYGLFNTPRDQRPPRFRSGWPDEIPYLNGGLFRTTVDKEKKYSVEGEILKQVIRDLIEGSDIGDNEGTIDPAVLGSVFERTINYLGGEIGTQKDKGAYYTPGDVTEKITSETVRQKIHDELVDVYAEKYPESIRERMEDIELSEMHQRIEEGEGWFGDSSDTKAAYERVGNLSIIDPACGSGHFLTTAMDEVQRARESLLRGLQHADEVSPKDRFESKHEIALNTIYGVDVEPVAVEIARLRVWLKIVDEGWDPSFGRLPNIELNIVSGNSLVGLPVQAAGQTAVDVYDDRVDELITLRENYKDDEGVSKEDVQEALNSLRDELNTEYLKRLTHTFEDEITSVDDLDDVFGAIDDSTLYPEIESVQIFRDDGESLSEEDIDRLDSIGCRTHKNSARLNIERRYNDLREGTSTVSNAEARETIEEDLRAILAEHFEFKEVVRQPLAFDLDNILGDPFHYVAEFPEISEEKRGRRTIDFDVVIGNPPYGNILNESEKVLINYYDTGDINNIVAQFVERQLEILSEDGYFGNITTLAVMQKSMSELHDDIRDTLANARAACFGLRGRTGIFEGVLIRTAIITGRKDPSAADGIETSDLLVFTNETRQKCIENVIYGKTEGLVLRDSIGGGGSRGPILPKVGPQIKRDILENLKQRDDRLFRDAYEKLDSDDWGTHPVFRSASGGYWITAMLDDLYRSSKIEGLDFESETDRKMAFLLLHSSLYYVHFATYSNQRDHLGTILGGFPFPDEQTVNENADRIESLADVLWEEMQTRFTRTGENRGRFSMSPLRPLIDEVDEFVGDLYDLTDEETAYTKNYIADFHDQSCRTGEGDTTLADFGINPIATDDD